MARVSVIDELTLLQAYYKFIIVGYREFAPPSLLAVAAITL